MKLKQLLTSLAATLALVLAGATAADSSLPEVTHDGLHLVKHSKLRAVWMKPGANLDEYSEVALLACYVAFNKNWQRNYNNQTMAAWGPKLEEKGIQKVTFSSSELEAFKAEAGAPVHANWIKDMNGKGLPAQELYDLVLSISQ